LLVGVGPVQATEIVEQVAGPCVIRIVLSGTPKESIVTLIEERTIVETVTLREGVKTTTVVCTLVIAWCSSICCIVPPCCRRHRLGYFVVCGGAIIIITISYEIVFKLMPLYKFNLPTKLLLQILMVF